MRLPNSFGSVTKLSGKRRKPYGARVTTGWTDDGKQIQSYIGYYEKRAEAIAALNEYNKHPYDIGSSLLTFSEVYEKWADYKFQGETVPNTYKAAYNRVPNLYNIPFTDIRKRHIQGEVDACELGYSTKKNIKILCNQIYKYAIDHDIVTVNHASNVELPAQEDSRIHVPFDEQELSILWKNSDDLGARIALVLSYTGLRPTELAKIKTENVHLDEHYMLGGMKTAAGKNRAIPIADKIYPIIADMYDDKNEYLLMDPRDNKPVLTYDRIRDHFWKPSDALKLLKRPHLPHDGRHTCASMLDDAGVALKTIQLILGHRAANLTQRVYTHKKIAQLVDAINTI